MTDELLTTATSVYGLSALVVVAGLVLVGLRRKAHPTAARIAIPGLLCVLADKLLTTMIGLFYPRIPPSHGASGGLTRAQGEALQLGGLTLDHLANVVGAIGWTLVLVGLFVAGARPWPFHRANAGSVR